MYWSGFIALYGSIALILSLWFFRIFTYNLSNHVYAIAFFDIATILGILFVMLNHGAKINSYFITHKGILLDHK